MPVSRQLAEKVGGLGTIQYACHPYNPAAHRRPTSQPRDRAQRPQARQSGAPGRFHFWVDMYRQFVLVVDERLEPVCGRLT